MAQAITHFLLPVILVSLFRDFYIRNRAKKKFPLHYVLIAGIGGILPDIDFAVFWVMRLFGSDVALSEIHRPFTHLFIFPIILLFIALVFSIGKARLKVCRVRKHELKWNAIFLMLAAGVLIHILLDSFFSGPTMSLWPLSTVQIGTNYLSDFFGKEYGLFMATLDGILFMIWVIYLELKHKISDFI